MTDMNCPTGYYTYWTCGLFEKQMVFLWDPVAHMCPCPRKEWALLQLKINILPIQQEKLQELPRKVNHVEEPKFWLVVCSSPSEKQSNFDW